jgi:hypothetical protein
LVRSNTEYVRLLLRDEKAKYVLGGKGHIAVKDPSSWKLSGGFPLREGFKSGSEGYAVAVFHQIHCLVCNIDNPLYFVNSWG